MTILVAKICEERSMRHGHCRRLKSDCGRESERGRATFARKANDGKGRKVGCYSPGPFARRKAVRSCKNGKRRFERVKSASWSTPARAQRLRVYKGGALPESEWRDLWEAPEPEAQIGKDEALAALDQRPQLPWKRRHHRHNLDVGHRVASRSTGKTGVVTCRRYPFVRIRYDGESSSMVGWHTSRSFASIGRADTFFIGDIVTVCDDTSMVSRELLAFNLELLHSNASKQELQIAQVLSEMSHSYLKILDTREAGTIVAVPTMFRNLLLPERAVSLANIRVFTVQTSQCDGVGDSLFISNVAGDQVASAPLDFQDPQRILEAFVSKTGLPLRMMVLLFPDGQHLPGTQPGRLLETLIAHFGPRASDTA